MKSVSEILIDLIVCVLGLKFNTFLNLLCLISLMVRIDGEPLVPFMFPVILMCVSLLVSIALFFTVLRVIKHGVNITL